MEMYYLFSGLNHMAWMGRPLDVQQEQVEVNGLKLWESNFHIYEMFCTNMEGFTPSIIYGGKSYQVYFHTQQTSRHLVLCEESYDNFGEDYHRPTQFCLDLCLFDLDFFLRPLA